MSTSLDSLQVFPWNANLETGIEIIDEQHQKLIALLNQLVGCLLTKNPVELSRIFEELKAYALIHFETEEKIWAETLGDDPWLLAHRSAHEGFLPALNQIREENGEEPIQNRLRDILKFLMRWLVHHIIDNDRQMAIVVNQVKAGVSLEEAKEASETEMINSDQVLIDTILIMYDELSSNIMQLMHEQIERRKVNEQLSRANLKLQRLATTDPLTGLFNRRHFIQVFEQELRRARRENNFLTFILMDIDHFKLLNDNHGHHVGDEALKSVAKRLKEICQRPGDFVFRLGGEEFGILLSGEYEMQKSGFAESIRMAIEQLQIPNHHSEVSQYVTVSMGMVSRIPEESDTLEGFMKISDERLYAAKQAGRNRIFDGNCDQ